jgi:hypothetical protein
MNCWIWECGNRCTFYVDAKSTRGQRLLCGVQGTRYLGSREGDGSAAESDIRDGATQNARALPGAC